MLEVQGRRPLFSGGLEAAALKPWHVDELTRLKPDQMFFAYDTPDDAEPLRSAGRMLGLAGFNRHKLRAYCLCGYEGDTFVAAEKRMWHVLDCGMYPMAMFYRDGNREPDCDWRKFQRDWARPATIYARLNK